MRPMRRRFKPTSSKPTPAHMALDSCGKSPAGQSAKSPLALPADLDVRQALAGNGGAVAQALQALLRDAPLHLGNVSLAP